MYECTPYCCTKKISSDYRKHCVSLSPSNANTFQQTPTGLVWKNNNLFAVALITHCDILENVKIHRTRLFSLEIYRPVQYIWRQSDFWYAAARSTYRADHIAVPRVHTFALILSSCALCTNVISHFSFFFLLRRRRRRTAPAFVRSSPMNVSRANWTFTGSPRCVRTYT